MREIRMQYNLLYKNKIHKNIINFYILKRVNRNDDGNDDD